MLLGLGAKKDTFWEGAKKIPWGDTFWGDTLPVFLFGVGPLASPGIDASIPPEKQPPEKIPPSQCTLNLCQL